MQGGWIYSIDNNQPSLFSVLEFPFFSPVKLPQIDFNPNAANLKILNIGLSSGVIPSSFTFGIAIPRELAAEIAFPTEEPNR